jgi:hypothetical protein
MDIVEIAHATIRIHESNPDKEYASWAYYSAIKLARELLAFNDRINALLDEVSNQKELLNED